jgi:excisionase family DNA binding protein
MYTCGQKDDSRAHGDVEMEKQRLLIRPVEAAHLLSVSRSKIYELLNSGVLPSIKLDGMTRIPLAALRKLAQPEERSSEEESP